MKFFDLRKPNQAHLYYVYVYPKEDDEKSVATLYKVGSLKKIKREMSDQHRKIDVSKVW